MEQSVVKKRSYEPQLGSMYDLLKLPENDKKFQRIYIIKKIGFSLILEKKIY